MLLRYEDVCLNPGSHFRKLFHFSNIQLTTKQAIKLFRQTKNLDQKQYRNPLSTLRISHQLPLKWLNELSKEAIYETQKKCGKEILFFNYTIIH